MVGKIKKRLDRSLGEFGKWVPISAESKIKDGQVVIGLKRKFGLVKNKLQTGWYQVEFSRFNPTGIERHVVCNLVFDPSLRDVGELVAGGVGEVAGGVGQVAGGVVVAGGVGQDAGGVGQVAGGVVVAGGVGQMLLAGSLNFLRKT